MAVYEFSHHRPGTLAEACQLGVSLGPGTFFLAGGTELLPDFGRGLETPAHLVALDGIPRLARIAVDDGELKVGAMATIREVAESPVVQRAFAPLAEAAATLGGPQLRNQATIGGNFCRAVPCADTPPMCICANARLRIAGVAGERSVPAESFFVGPRKTVLEPGEVLVEVVLRCPPETSGASYQRFSLRGGSSLAVASVAAWVALEEGRVADARITLGSVAPVPLPAREAASLLRGEVPGEGLFARAGAAAAAESRPISDIRGSAAFRRQLVDVLTRRALTVATARARAAAPGRSRSRKDAS